MIFSSINSLLNNFIIVGGLNFHKPKLLRKILKKTFYSFIKSSLPRCMSIALDYSCNFNCEHCSAESLKKQGGKNLSIEEYKHIADNAMQMGILYFIFTGGEPILKRDLFEIIKIFKPDENLISLQTNGWYVNEEFIDNYKKIGGDLLSISIDSTEEKTHDMFRNQSGSWKKALSAVELAKQKKLNVIISYTLTHDKLINQDFQRMIELSKSLRAFLSVSIAVPAGKWKGNDMSLLTENDRKILNKLLKKNGHVRTDLQNNWRKHGCPAAKENIYLTPYGDLLPCPFIHLSLGNVRENSIREIYDNSIKLPYLRNYNAVCIAGEDKHFINNAGCYNKESSSLPVKYSESPLFCNEYRYL